MPNKTFELLSEYFKQNNSEKIEKTFWNVLETLHYSNDYEAWSADEKINLLKTMKGITDLFLELERVIPNN